MAAAPDRDVAGARRLKPLPFLCVKHLQEIVDDNVQSKLESVLIHVRMEGCFHNGCQFHFASLTFWTERKLPEGQI